MSVKIPSCDTCKQEFQPGQDILTSVSCGHSFHKTSKCVEELDVSQRFDRVEVYSGGCRVVGCEYDGNLVLNSSEASPTTLLFRNLPLEKIVKKASHPSRSPSVPVTKAPLSQSKPSQQTSNVSTRHQVKRAKLDNHVTISGRPNALQDVNDNDLYERNQNQKPSALALPVLPPSEQSDSDDDDAEVMANLVAASQALQRMPADDSVMYDSTLAFDEHDTEEGEQEDEDDEDQSSSQQDEEEPPPDPYGMPPLSQWKRSSKR